MRARDRLKRIEVRTTDERSLKDQSRVSAQVLFRDHPPAVLEAVGAIVDDSIHETLSCQDLREAMRGRGFVARSLSGAPQAAGEDAAATLGRRPDTQRVIALRARLAEIYDARFRHIDPGLPIAGGPAAVSDVRKRFVVPDVEPAGTLGEVAIEPDEPPDDALGEDDRVWEFDAYAEPHRPSDRAQPPGDQFGIPSVPLEEWLLRGESSLLISGAPGSGKSTILRCLALDLLRTPELFPNVSERFRSRIPLLIPFALWSRLTSKEGREVALAEVVRATLEAFVPAEELEESFIDALSNEGLVLLIDGLDEYGDEQAARLTLATIESFVRTHDVYTVVTARPAGLRRLGPTGFWTMSRLSELSRPQQRDLTTRLLTEQEAAPSPVAHRVDQFFQQLEDTGRLQTLAGNPLLLYGLLSVATRQIILPKTRFRLFQQLMETLLDVHPNRRATAAIEVQSGTRVFSADDVRREALARLAFEVQLRGADAGIDDTDARSIVEAFLRDLDGPGWSRAKARRAARELVNVDAETSGLLVESGPEEIAFCHPAFREHLAGLELESWSLERQTDFVSARADDPRWRGAIHTLVQSFSRTTDVECLLEAIQGGQPAAVASVDRRLLLADCAFAAAPLCGPVGRQVALAALDRIEAGTDEAERRELLGLALDGPRAGPIGEEIVARLGRWWPSVVHWHGSLLYEQLGNWPATPELARTLQRALRGDDNQLAAAAGLARAFRGDAEVGGQLSALAHESEHPWVTAAALDALSRGWPTTAGLDDWLREAERSPSAQLRNVATLALYRRGRRGDVTRDSLLRALGWGWDRFGEGRASEIIEALVTHWAHDEELQDACWAAVGRAGASLHDIQPAKAQSILMRIHGEDARVAPWIRDEIDSSRDLPFGLMASDVALLESVISAHPDVRAAVESKFEDEQVISGDP